MGFFQLVSRIVGGINYAAYELNTLTYRAAPIQQRQRVVIPGLPANQAVEVDLINTLPFPIVITGILVDKVDDDPDHLGENNTTDNEALWVDFQVQSINRKSKKVEAKTTFRITSFPELTNELILEPQTIYRFKSSRNLNKLIIVGKPAYLMDEIIFLDGIIID